MDCLSENTIQKRYDSIAVEGKRGIYNVENKSVISGGGKEKQQENGGNRRESDSKRAVGLARIMLRRERDVKSFSS